ncbi:MAG: hypothetical protein IJ880_17475 [Bacilli bacterium]|nr:hypothetical protein [Bacilli bacterium]
MDDLQLGLLDELCDKLDESGIEGNVIERDSYGRPYVSIWPGSYGDGDLRKSEMFTVVVTDQCYQIKPPNKYCDYFIKRFRACRSRKNGYYVVSCDSIIRTIRFLFDKENNMEKEKKTPHFKVKSITYFDDAYGTDIVLRHYVNIEAEILPGACFTTAPKVELINAIQSIGIEPSTDIKDVIFNDPATIVIWADGSKTVVKAENEPFDPEKGLAMAISKRVFGNKHNYYDIFKKYVGRYEKKQKRGGKKNER